MASLVVVLVNVGSPVVVVNMAVPDVLVNMDSAIVVDNMGMDMELSDHWTSVVALAAVLDCI